MGDMLILMLIALCLILAGLTFSMARITLGSMVNTISGSIGEMVYSTWKGISYIRRKATTIVNSQSTDQAAIRTRIAECAKYWNDTLTVAQKDAWEIYAASLPIGGGAPGDIIKPAKGPFSGYTAFLRNNLIAFTGAAIAMGAFIAVAPIGVTPPDAPISVAAAYAAGAMTVDWVEGTVKGTNCRIWCRSTTVRSIHAQLRISPLANALTQIFTGITGAKGGYVALALAPGLYDVQCDIIDADGQCSPPSTLLRSIVVV